ncbi:MAG: hypothetical protein M1831_002392 [Alyxoria varia]|nr:MAG: hypothetical protein M1831_002392 [Alyxoria varia]
MIEAFKDEEIDVGIGLTEAWVAGLAKHWISLRGNNPEHGKKDAETGFEDPYRIVGEYVRSPLRWAVVTGRDRHDLGNLKDLLELGSSRGTVKVGVSRMGSGSHVMSTVLASRLSSNQTNPSTAFEPVVCGSLDHLIAAVNNPPSSESSPSESSKPPAADFFMWEHYTTKPHWSAAKGVKLKHLGELPTPWNGWHITARRAPEIAELLDMRLFPSLESGKQEFMHDRNKAVELICDELNYERQDAEGWYEEVEFAPDFGKVNLQGLDEAVNVLKKVDLVEENLTSLNFDGNAAATQETLEA